MIAWRYLALSLKSLSVCLSLCLSICLAISSDIATTRDQT